MDQDHLWSLSPLELARQCKLLAEGNAGVEPALQEEAKRLCASWEDALDYPHEPREERSRKAALQDGLRKRTIEILIRAAEHS